MLASKESNMNGGFVVKQALLKQSVANSKTPFYLADKITISRTVIANKLIILTLLLIIVTLRSLLQVKHPAELVFPFNILQEQAKTRFCPKTDNARVALTLKISLKCSCYCRC